MTGPVSDIELLAGVIRTIEEVRSDMRAVMGLPPGSDSLNAPAGTPEGYWHDRLIDIGEHVRIVYQRMISEQVPRWSEHAAALVEPADEITLRPATDIDLGVIGALAMAANCADEWHTDKARTTDACPSCPAVTAYGDHGNSGPG